jgi:hypothetical protein
VVNLYEETRVGGIWLSFEEYIEQGMPAYPKSTGREPVRQKCPKCGGHKFWCWPGEREIKGWCGDNCGWHGTRKEWDEHNEGLINV